MNFIKRFKQTENQWQICRHDTMRFERNEQNDMTLVPGSQETI